VFVDRTAKSRPIELCVMGDNSPG
jgi:hypothetical protein